MQITRDKKECYSSKRPSLDSNYAAYMPQKRKWPSMYNKPLTSTIAFPNEDFTERFQVYSRLLKQSLNYVKLTHSYGYNEITDGWQRNPSVPQQQGMIP